MPTYVVLYRFTEQGRKKIKSTVRRAAQVRRDNQRRGFTVLGTYWTQGNYDLVSIVDAPSEQAMLSGLFNIAQAGNVTSDTLRAYTDREMQRALRAGAPVRRRAAGRRTARKATARKTTRRRTTRKATARKTTRRRTTRKATARKTTRRTARKATARKTTRRRPARKATARRPARRTTARRRARR